VLAIEPDLRQAAIVKRIVREKVLADVAVVDSREAALEAMRTTIPDVLLLSALMSPRDEDELIAHLRTLEHADHLQTHTIPQLASTLNPTESRGPRGLLSAFRRKKEPEVAPSGCDPDLFAEEILVFLQRAADKKRERSAAAAAPGATPADTAWRAGPSHKPAGPASAVDATPEMESGASSSWSSPFEWKPSTASSPMTDPDALPASSDASLASTESLMSHLRPPAGIPTVDDLNLSGQVEDLTVSSDVDDPILLGQAEEAVFAPIELTMPEPPAAMAAAPVLESQPAIEVRPSRIKDSGSAIRHKGLGIRDRVPVRLGALASWARSEDRAADAAQGSDDLRALLTGLAVPPAVVSVGYGRGCRIRRVRVLAAREHQDAEAVGAVIISRRVLAEQRSLRDQQQA
jgi:CheY-like chemotaxis protein